jgi:hypothetical protein
VPPAPVALPTGAASENFRASGWGLPQTRKDTTLYTERWQYGILGPMVPKLSVHTYPRHPALFISNNKHTIQGSAKVLGPLFA